MTIKHKDTSKFEREDRYLVIKRSDIDKFLTCSEKEQLYKLADVVCDGRIIFSGSSLECIVVESDWPIYNDVWNMVEAIATNQPTELARLRKSIEEHPNFEAFIRAFWRRIEPYKNDYDKELPSEIPTEFIAHMTTAGMLLRENSLEESK